MKQNTHSLDLTPQELHVIEAALHTQEKILSVQSRAGGDGLARTRLEELKSVLASLNRQRPTSSRGFGFSLFGRSLFG